MGSLLDLMVKITCDDEASGQVEDISQGIIGKLGKAAKTAAKALAGMWAVKKVVDFGKAAYESYSRFEQLEGGISKLYGNAGMSVEEYAQSVGKSVDAVMADYQRNEQAQTAMMEQAQRAWKTAGMDANTYMQNATMFSASLINSLGGDTAKAAEMTDRAMTAISDNVNTFGTNMESVTDAFRGFSRQNYTMLDNLSLGYAGTKEGMEQLIADANEWGAANGAASDLSIDSFADVVVAIEQIQKKQGIYGTTAREAMATIEGSVTATKAAWQNFLTAIGSGDQEFIQSSISGIVDGIFGTFNEEVGKREGGVIANVLPVIQNVFHALQDTLPDLMSQLLEAAVTYLNDTFSTSFDIDTINSVIAGLSEALSIVADVILTVADAVLTLMDTLGPFLPAIVAGVATLVAMNNILSAVGAAVTFFTTVVIPAVSAIGSFGGAISALVTLLGGPIPIIAAVVAAIVTFIATNEDARNAIKAAWEAIKSAVSTAITTVKTTVSGAWNAIRQWTSETWETIKTTVSNALGSMVGYVVGCAGQMFEAGVALVAGILDGSTQEGQAVREWFANLPATIVDALGNVGTLLIDVGGKFVDGLVRGIEKAAPNITSAIKTAFQSVIDFFGGIADFLSDPIGSIQRGLDSLNTSFEGTNKSASDNMKGVESSVSGSMGRSSGAITSYNKTKLEGKRATAEVNGNAVSGGARSAVGNTDSAIRNLSNKTVYANVYGSATDNDVANRIWNMVDAIKSLVSKTVNVVTNFLTGGSGNGSGGAWGGIHYHADGGIKIADRFGAGVPFGGAQDRYGEKGAEALIPLTSRYGGDFARMMGEAAAKSMGGGDTYNINLNYEAGTTANEMAYDLVNALQLMQRAGVR